LQVDIDHGGQAHIEFIETNQVRWAHLEISIREHTRIDALITAMLEQGQEAASDFTGPKVVRCTLRGNGPLHRDLQRDGMAEELLEQLQSVLPAETVRIATGPELDFESLARTESMISDFLKLADRALEDPELRQKLMDNLG